MAHEIETMAFANEVPWHGLGNRVDGSVTVDEMLVAAGLDWEVEQHDCFADIEGVRVPINRKALIRSTDRKLLSVTGEKWVPFQNKDALEFFREYTEAGGATLETAGSLRGGKIVWGLARVASGFTLNGRDQVNGYILLCSPHEVGHATTVRTTSIRVVCANTLAMAGGVQGKNAEYRQGHWRDFDADAAKQTVLLVKEQIAQLELEAKLLQSMKMSQYDTVRSLAKFFQPAAPHSNLKMIEEHTKTLIEMPETRNSKLEAVLWANENAPGATPGDAWGLLNGVTYWADHLAGRSSDARMSNSWFGNTGVIKDKMKRELLEMAS